MKTLTTVLRATLALLFVPLALRHPLAAFILLLCFGWLFLSPAEILRECRLGTPTLITQILTGKIIKPLRTKVPELGFFSVDWGMTGGEFAPPVKFGQTVTSHLITAPTATAFTPGSGLGTGTTNPKDLLTDANVAIDQAAVVPIKLPVADAVKYLLEPAFAETLNQATISLGRYIVSACVAKFSQANFSQEKTATVAGAEYETLTDARAALNKLGTLAPRFILGETNWVNQLAKDPVIISGQYYGQRIGDDPYLTLENIAGFSAVREFPNMPTNSVVLGTFTVVAATDVMTVSVAHNLSIGDRVRLTTTTTLPAGAAVLSDYYVLTVPSATTVTISKTLGGGTLDMTDTGTGVHTITKFEAINAVAFEKRAIHIAFRQLLDNDELAASLGIPQTNRKIVTHDAETGVAVTWYFWQDNTGTNPTGDVYASAVIAFGIRAGREITGGATPAGAGAQAAGSGLDYAALRLVETAAAAAA